VGDGNSDFAPLPAVHLHGIYAHFFSIGLQIIATRKRVFFQTDSLLRKLQLLFATSSYSFQILFVHMEVEQEMVNDFYRKRLGYNNVILCSEC